MDQVPLGNKTPRPGYARQIWCPACRGLLQYPLSLTSGHVLTECMVVEGTRIREGVRAFLDECAKAGRSEKTAHYLYVNGMDSKGEKLSVQAHLQRGASLSRLTDMWLNTWGEEEED